MTSNKLYYTITLDFTKNFNDSQNIIEGLLNKDYINPILRNEVKSDEKVDKLCNNIKFIKESKIIHLKDPYTSNCKVLCVLDNAELYYKDNYKYFKEFRDSFNSCIISFNSLGNGLYLDKKIYEWEYNKIHNK
jgi:hypothetical protein